MKKTDSITLNWLNPKAEDQEPRSQVIVNGRPIGLTIKGAMLEEALELESDFHPLCH